MNFHFEHAVAIHPVLFYYVHVLDYDKLGKCIKVPKSFFFTRHLGAFVLLKIVFSGPFESEIVFSCPIFDYLVDVYGPLNFRPFVSLVLSPLSSFMLNFVFNISNALRQHLFSLHLLWFAKRLHCYMRSVHKTSLAFTPCIAVLLNPQQNSIDFETF